VAAVADAGGGEADRWADALAPVAAGRLVALMQDVPDNADNRAVEDRLLALPRDQLPWTAQLELARLGDRAARRRRDPELLARAAETAGCARQVFQAGAVGRLPHVDLDRADSAPAAPPSWRAATAAGCRLSLSSWDGNAGVQTVRAAIDVDGGGTFDLVLDFAGEARLRVDGGAWQRHGSELGNGPTVTATGLGLAQGRHTIELRVGLAGLEAELSLLVLRAHGGPAVHFIDPRPAAAPASVATVLGSRPAFVPPPVSPAGAPVASLLTAYAQAFVADRVGDADTAAVAAERLGRSPRFAVGLALAGAIAEEDPTRPPSFARDAARAFLRRAVTVDAQMARAFAALAALELEDDRPREAIADARAALRAAPDWSAPELTLAAALNARGLELDADQALDRAAEKALARGRDACAVGEALFRRAEQRRDLRARDAAVGRLSGCDSEIDGRADRLRARGDRAGALAWLRGSVPLTARADDLRAQIAALLVAAGDARAAVAELTELTARAPRDARLRIQLGDALMAAGQGDAARQTLADLAARHPSAEEVRRAARAAGVALPLDAYRLDGAAVIAGFRQSGRRYDAPAVVILDRSVARVLPSGEQMTLTHTIVLLQSKEAIDHWGEVNVPADAEVLLLRTHKPDGSTRDAEVVAGKESISAADLAIGDFLEWETLESKPASDAFPGGFLGDRFYFQSFDAPLDRSELILVTPPALALEIDRRAGAPAGQPGAGPGGSVVTTFRAEQVPQLFAERASVPPIEYVPSVRVSSGVSWQAWARFLREQTYGTTRASPALRALAATLASAIARSGDGPRVRAAAIVAWVTSHIESAEDLRDAAPLALARGRGNRLGLVLALARELGVPAHAVLARSLLTGDARAQPAAPELEDFADPLVAFDISAGGGSGVPGGGAPAIFADVRLKHASFGYLPPHLDGAFTVSLATGTLGRAESHGVPDQRIIDMTVRLDEDGSAQALATEQLTGWPALEWAELVDRMGADRGKLRQDFEQRWLGANFPGARLQELEVDFLGAGGASDRDHDARAPVTSGAPPAAETGGVRVRYSFVSANFGLRGDRELTLAPTFFRSQPGRRFAVEPSRHTTLLMGFDVPFRLTATVQLPRAATVDAPPVEGAAGVVARKGGYRFVEERSARPGSPEVLILRREAAVPIMRVSPDDYGGVAADLRRVDGLEQREIRIRLPPRRGGSPP
ncbi:MAG TPA: tetratricopeptide repeat protein, partial [Polyangia bacterium]|nr:tetratricopeptide repeat protein [Polyangia bacterium]